MTNKLTILIAVLFLAFSTSCEKEEENSMNADAAAEVIAKAIGSDAGGTNQQFAEAGTLAGTQKNTLKPSNTNTDLTVTYQSEFGADIEYKYIFNYTYSVVPNIAMQRAEFILSYTAEGFLKSEYLSSEDLASGNYVVYESANTSYYTINGEVSRNGTQTTTLGGTKTYTSELDLVFTNLQSNKLTKQIDSGTATVAFKGSISTGEEFSFNGMIVYNDDNTATLTIGGAIYTVDLVKSVIVM